MTVPFGSSRSQVKVQLSPEPAAEPCGSPPTDQVTSWAEVEVVARKSALCTAALVISSGSLFELGDVIVSEVMEGPRPPTGLMIADVWVIDCPTPRVLQLSVTRTRL